MATMKVVIVGRGVSAADEVVAYKFVDAADAENCMPTVDKCDLLVERVNGKKFVAYAVDTGGTQSRVQVFTEGDSSWLGLPDATDLASLESLPKFHVA